MASPLSPAVDVCYGGSGGRTIEADGPTIGDIRDLWKEDRTGACAQLLLGADREFGEAGNDQIGTKASGVSADGGNDYMDGGSGGDDIGGGAGDDTLIDTAASDVDNCYGEAGNDIINVQDGDGDDKADGASGTDTATVDVGDSKQNIP